MTSQHQVILIGQSENLDQMLYYVTLPGSSLLPGKRLERQQQYNSIGTCHLALIASELYYWTDQYRGGETVNGC